MELSPRMRWILDTYAVGIVAVLIILALFGGYVGFVAHTTTDTVQYTETVGSWTVETDFYHGATVQRDTHVFPAGDRLENRTRYFTEIAPVMSGGYIVTHQGTDGTPASIEVELSLILRSVESVEIDDEPHEEIHWEETVDTWQAESTELADSEPFRIDFEANVTELGVRIAEIETDLGASPGTAEMLLVADLAIEGETAGETFTVTQTDRLELTPRSGTYTVRTDLAEPVVREVTRTELVEVPPSLLARYGSILFGLAALLGAIGFLIARDNGHFELTAAEYAQYTFDTARSDYDEWISPGDVPAENRDTVQLTSLQSVVDVAIDSNRRVIEVGECERYVVIVDDVTYVYEPTFDTEDAAAGTSGHGGDNGTEAETTIDTSE